MDQWRAARLGRVDILDDILAEEGANPNLTRWSGSTALHKAAAEGHADCVELLLDKGADVNMRAAWGWYSPLHLAMRGGHEDVARLVAAGVSPDIHGWRTNEPERRQSPGDTSNLMYR